MATGAPHHLSATNRATTNRAAANRAATDRAAKSSRPTETLRAKDRQTRDVRAPRCIRSPAAVIARIAADDVAPHPERIPMSGMMAIGAGRIADNQQRRHEAHACHPATSHGDSPRATRSALRKILPEPVRKLFASALQYASAAATFSNLLVTNTRRKTANAVDVDRFRPGPLPLQGFGPEGSRGETVTIRPCRTPFNPAGSSTADNNSSSVAPSTFTVTS